MLSFLLVLILLLTILGGAAPLYLARADACRITYGGCMAISALLLLGGAYSLLIEDTVHALALPLGLPWVGSRFRLDDLSAFFLMVAGLGTATASLYAIGYSRHEQEPERVLPFYPLFLAGMFLVILADDAFTFLFAWEVMSVTSCALVVSHHKSPGTLSAGYVYLIMATFGALTLLLGFGLLAGVAGGYAFDTMRAAEIPNGVAALTLALVLIGAGSKAGLVPLHAWLPLAHPAAPSHVSALMSGVMTKVAVYGFVRIVFDLLGQPAWWWGAVVMLIGGLTAVLGMLFALMQRDLKRLLAYSTVENIGIIFVGLGLALAFEADGFPAAAALALTAALFHIFNHSVFKSLLFFGCGAVLGATGERDMERLGGLIHRMPRTALTFLVGSAAISALPPFNGFVSEWLTFQSILLSQELPQWELRFLVPAIGALLALSAALAATCFVRAFGITFLGRPRSAAAEKAVETDRYSLAAMGCLAGFCLLAGILPGLWTDGLAIVVGPLTGGGQMPDQKVINWATLVPIAAERSSYSGLLVFVFVLFSAYSVAWLFRRIGVREVRRGPAWDCGFPNADPATQYTASSFAQPIRRTFGTALFRARETVVMPAPGDVRAARFTVEVLDLIWDYLYMPAARVTLWVADRLNPFQFLTIRQYLMMVFSALVFLLGVLALWR